MDFSQKKAVLFDLDGTITNSEPGILNCVQYALEKMGIESPDRKELLPFIGPPLHDTFRDMFSLSDEDAARATAFYRERYAPIGKFEAEVYPGAEEMLRDLKDAGKKLILATSKPTGFATDVLDHFGLTGYFDFIGGATLDGSRSTKEDVIEYVLQSGMVPDRDDLVMVGDTKFDVTGAAYFGIPTIAVTYGFGPREELIEAGAAVLADSAAEIAGLLLGK